MSNSLFSLQVVVIIPIYNPDDKFRRLLFNLAKQSDVRFQVLLIDSGVDKSYQKYIPEELNVVIRKIAPVEFNHGGTRAWGMSLYPEADVYVFLTQDAILADEHSVANLVKIFADEKVGAVYGRQLPHEDARLFAKTARAINYGVESHKYTFADKEKHGMKTCFMSNSFAAYRRLAMEDVGGFPTNTIFAEDMYVAAKMLMKGWKIGYAANACVYHSHNYSIMQEFKRYFDMGVFHAREDWIRKIFGAAEGEGKKFVLYEIKQIIRCNPLLLGEMFCRDFAKWFGYRMGIMEKYLPEWVKKRISMNRRYWLKNF